MKLSQLPGILTFSLVGLSAFASASQASCETQARQAIAAIVKIDNGVTLDPNDPAIKVDSGSGYARANDADQEISVSYQSAGGKCMLVSAVHGSWD